MRFQCEHCQGISTVGPEDYGRQVACGHCGDPTSVPKTRYSPASVIDDFVLDRVLGQGGMGTVFLAHQITLDRPVALKVLRDGLASNSGFVVEFVKEARAAGRLNHPNIVQSHAVGEEDGLYYFAMEYVEGQTLSEMLSARGRLPEKEAISVARQIAEAIGYAWKEQKLVHRDVKPDNIMMTARGIAKLTDLGLARPAEEMRLGNEDVYGTPQYISPEQLLGEPVDTRADIYSLGATFYHMVTGKFPYEGDSANEIARRHLEETPVPPQKVCREVSAGLGAVILRMMSRDKGDRYSDAGAVVADLDRLRRGETPAAMKGARAGRRAKDNKRDASSAASVGATGSSSMAGKKIKMSGRGGGRSGAPKISKRPSGGAASSASRAPAAAPQPPPQKQSALPWVLGCIIVLLLAGVGIYARSVFVKYTPATPEAAETLYLSLETLAPGEREAYEAVRKFVGNEQDYVRTPDQLNHVADLARRFMIDFPDSLFTRSAESITFAELYGAPKFFEDELRRSAAPLAGRVSMARYAFDELYVQHKREEAQAEEAEEVKKYRYAQTLVQMKQRVATWGQERKDAIEAQAAAVRESMEKRREAFKNEQADMLSRSLDLGNLLEFDLASKRAADAIAFFDAYPLSVERDITESVRGSEFDRTKTWRHQLAHELNLDVALVSEEQQKVIAELELEAAKQVLPPFVDEERDIMRKRSKWLAGLSESLQFAAEYHTPIAENQKKLEGLKLKLPKYLKPNVLTVHEVNLTHRDSVVVHIKEWSEKGAWAVMENARIPYMDLPYSEYDKLAKEAAGRVPAAKMALRRGAAYFWRLQTKMGVEELRAAGGSEGRFMLDHEELVNAQAVDKRVKWISERVLRLLDQPANPDKKEDDQKLELIQNRKDAVTLFGKLAQLYGNTPEWKKHQELIARVEARLQQ